MRQSDTIKELAGALCKFQASMGAITKDATNPFFKSRYASLSAIIEDTREPLAKVGLSYAQFPTGGAVQGSIYSGLNTTLMHTSGEWIADEFPISPVDNKPQSLGSAITYARRYALCAILGLQVEDDDGNEASKPAKPAEKKVTPPPAIAKERDAKKKLIKELADKLRAQEDGKALQSAEDYQTFVFNETQKTLVEENYEEIIKALEFKLI